MRLIDGDELLSIVRHMTVVDKSVMHRILIQMPTVDAVEVVRCRDCQYWKRDHELDGYPLFEGHMVCKYAIGNSFVRYPHDFCSKGVRKDCNNEAD